VHVVTYGWLDLESLTGRARPREELDRHKAGTTGRWSGWVRSYYSSGYDYGERVFQHTTVCTGEMHESGARVRRLGVDMDANRWVDHGPCVGMTASGVVSDPLRSKC